MKNLFVATLPIGLALVSAQAFAENYTIHGTTCQPVPSSVSCIEYTQFGVHNTCATTQTVECPIALAYTGNPTVNQVYYVAYDRNSSTNLSCTIQKTNFDGLFTYSTTLDTSGSGAAATSKIAFPNVPLDGWWRIRCTIPAVQSGSFSHLTNIFLGTI